MSNIKSPKCNRWWVSHKWGEWVDVGNDYLVANEVKDKPRIGYSITQVRKCNYCLKTEVDVAIATLPIEQF